MCKIKLGRSVPPPPQQQPQQHNHSQWEANEIPTLQEFSAAEHDNLPGDMLNSP